MRRCIAVCLSAFLVLAQTDKTSDDEKSGADQQLEEVQERLKVLEDKFTAVSTALTDGKGKVSSAKIEPLGMTVRLEFKFEGKLQGSADLVCAARDYSLLLGKGSGDGWSDVTIKGQVANAEAGKLLVTFEVTVDYETENNDKTGIVISGSAMIPLGKEVQIGTLREHTLKLLVTKVDFEAEE